MNPQSPSFNPNSIKYRFAKKFFPALERIRGQRPATSSSCNNPREVFQRYRRVKRAADKSLAVAVGSRRSWSRAMLCKIRNRRHGNLARRRIKINKKPLIKDDAKENKKKNGDHREVGFDQAKELRKLVPGGEAMDLCRLLEEAVHYIKCLNSQVQVMRSIADFYST